ncbi:hypothetical protein JOF53_004601 [Crossiella equi]|uniref:SD-repeat containing protein B domain-containing protein n=1 Tax=Crossiella equi TaxID=130796 RepID=A0ABS5AGM6_9PSEU|nr:SdrD B-like domain-containing protein [Crossiella equi]MBP2475729.1 hypothetical protein [Crossiella equi]
MNLRQGAVVLAGVSALSLAGPVAVAEEAAPTGVFGGAVWFDRDADGTRDAGEPGRWEAEVSFFDVLRGKPAGKAVTDTEGRYTSPKLPFGLYRIGHRLTEYAATTVPVRFALLGEDGQRTVDFGVRGASVSGAVWHDADRDGRQDAAEGPLADVTVAAVQPVTRYTTSGADGQYRIEDLPAGRVRLRASSTATPQWLTLTRPGRDSAFAWGSYTTRELRVRPGQDVRGVNAGYAESHYDGTLAVTTDRDPASVRVGETLDVTVYLANKGDTGQRVAVSLFLPAGVRVQGVGGDWTVVSTGPNVVVNSEHAVEPGRRERALHFTLVLDAPLTEPLQFHQRPDAGRDLDPSNDGGFLWVGSRP